MGEVVDAVNEAVEKARESKLNTIVAVAVAVIATFMALCNVKSGNIVQNIALAQSQSVDQWSYYQSKSTKQHIAENAVEQLMLERDLAQNLSSEQHQKLDDAIEKQRKNSKKYDQEKEDIKKQAVAYEATRDALNMHNDQFDASEALLSVAIALLGVTALTQKRWMLAVAGAFAVFGGFMGVAGFAKLSFHADFLARLLG